MGTRGIQFAVKLLSVITIALIWIMASAPAWAKPTPIRVVSYNIYLGASVQKEREARDAGDERKRLKYSIAHAFMKEGRLRFPDIMGTQELCAYQGGWQLQYFEELLGGDLHEPVYSVHGFEDPTGGGYGNCQRSSAIFSRFPIMDSGVIQLQNLSEARSAVWADLDIDGRLVRVYNAHLESSPKGDGVKGRLIQTKQIIEHLLQWRAHYPDAPVILLGDLNTLGHIIDPFIRESSIKLVEKYLKPSLPHWTITHRYLIHQIDWIFADRIELLSSNVVHIKLSDHYPIVADYLLP